MNDFGFDIWVFTHLRLWIMGLLTILVGLMELWKAYLPDAKRAGSKALKAFNWIFVGLVFFSMEVLSQYIELTSFRAWLRLAMFVLIISEFGYHSNVLPDVLGFVKLKVSNGLRKIRRGTNSRLPL